MDRPTHRKINQHPPMHQHRLWALVPNPLRRQHQQLRLRRLQRQHLRNPQEIIKLP